MRLFSITIIPHHKYAILSVLILFKTTRPRAYLFLHRKLLFCLLQQFCCLFSKRLDILPSGVAKVLQSVCCIFAISDRDTK